jgi:hypothetical protein
VQASTLSAIAGSTSAGIAAISATIAAIGAFNSRKSAQASETALRETRRQRELDNARTELNALATMYDDVLALVHALAVDRSRNPAAVERARSVVQRSMVVVGVTTPALVRLVAADAPLSSGEIVEVRSQLSARSAALRARLIDDPGSSPQSNRRSAGQ